MFDLSKNERTVVAEEAAGEEAEEAEEAEEKK